MIKRIHLTFLLSALLLFLCACVTEPGSDQPAPEAARRFLKLRGYDFDVPSFFSAASAGDELAVNGFLSAGIDPNAKDDNGDTVLTAAAERGDLKIVNALLRGRADVNAKGRNNWTALLLALEAERFEVAELLIKQPALDVKAETPKGMTALMVSVWHKRPDFVRKLLQLGSEINHQDKDGDTSVHGAAWLGSASILEMLLDAGANPNLKNKLGGTALMWAAAYGNDEEVRMLLDKGADPHLKDVDGVTAAGWAAKNGQGNIGMLLRQAENSSKAAGREQ
jgi:ankyrin repeat protein